MPGFYILKWFSYNLHPFQLPYCKKSVRLLGIAKEPEESVELRPPRGSAHVFWHSDINYQ